jgi:hypothetical protein
VHLARRQRLPLAVMEHHRVVVVVELRMLTNVLQISHRELRRLDEVHVAVVENEPNALVAVSDCGEGSEQEQSLERHFHARIESEVSESQAIFIRATLVTYRPPDKTSEAFNHRHHLWACFEINTSVISVISSLFCVVSRPWRWLMFVSCENGPLAVGYHVSDSIRCLEKHGAC